MEDLQDAIEDAQFINAMNDDSPKPTKSWAKLTDIELVDFKKKSLASNPNCFSIEEICGNCLGFHMFLKMVQDQGDYIEAYFIRDVALYKECPSLAKGEFALDVNKVYLKVGSNQMANMYHEYPLSICRRDYLSIPPSEMTSRQDTAVRSKSYEQSSAADWRQFLDHSTAPSLQNALCLSGKPLENFEDVLKNTPTVLTPDTDNKLVDVPLCTVGEYSFYPTMQLFDEIESVVFAYIKDKYEKQFFSSPVFARYLTFLAVMEKPVNDEDFSLFRVLGRGGFGVVSGCKRCQSGKLYAMKVMDRKRIKLKRAESLCNNERNVLITVHSKFIVCLNYAFATENDLYLVLDLMIGGDLGFHLNRKGRFSKREAKYYTARTILGIRALHDFNIVYRDLKPDNIMMDELGRTKISDMGLAVRLPPGGITGACGTRGYWAPEMLRRDDKGARLRYGLCVDWFSLGCVCYEFYYGVCPFRTDVARSFGGFDKKDKEKAIDLAVREMHPTFDPDLFDPVTIDFISRLLDKNPDTRLGAHGAIEVMSHPYFGNRFWEKMIHETILPPVVPRRDLNVASQHEIGSFVKSSKAKVELTEVDREMFSDWNFLQPESYLVEVVEYLRYEESVVSVYDVFCEL